MRTRRLSAWTRIGRLLIAVVVAATPSASRATEPRKPPGLRVGDTIRFVAPAGEVRPEAVALAKSRLERLGFRVLVPENIDRRRGYLAGTDQQRADELMQALLDPEVDAVFPVTGGFGMTRILDRIDYEAIARRPKVVIGFSDITALHLALAARCNWITFHAPNPEFGLGSRDGLPAFHANYLWRNLLAERNTVAQPIEYQPPQSDRPLIAVRPGVARGRLAGGNLSLIAALMGTPYEIQAAGRVLFLEDIGEAPYRIDRMLSQLRLAGKLDGPAAVILGAFYRCTADPGDPTLSLDEVIDDYFGQADYPVVKRFPAGHGPFNATLPMGAIAEVDADRPRIRVMENPVRP